MSFNPTVGGVSPTIGRDRSDSCEYDQVKEFPQAAPAPKQVHFESKENGKGAPANAAEDKSESGFLYTIDCACTDIKKGARKVYDGVMNDPIRRDLASKIALVAVALFLVINGIKPIVIALAAYGIAKFGRDAIEKKCPKNIVDNIDKGIKKAQELFNKHFSPLHVGIKVLTGGAMLYAATYLFAVSTMTAIGYGVAASRYKAPEAVSSSKDGSDDNKRNV